MGLYRPACRACGYLHGRDSARLGVSEISADAEGACELKPCCQHVGLAYRICHAAADALVVRWEVRCYSTGGKRTFLKQDAEDGADLLVSRRRHRLCSLTGLCLCKPDIWVSRMELFLTWLHCLPHCTSMPGIVERGLGHSAAQMSSSDWHTALKTRTQTELHKMVGTSGPRPVQAVLPCHAVSRGRRLICCSSRGSRKLVLPAGLALGG